jgi:hypothetical protein
MFMHSDIVINLEGQNDLSYLNILYLIFFIEYPIVISSYCNCLVNTVDTQFKNSVWELDALLAFASLKRNFLEDLDDNGLWEV